MRKLTTCRQMAVFFACWSLLVPGPLRAADGAGTADRAAAHALDVELQSGGRLAGRVVDASGHPRATSVLLLDRRGNQIGSTQSDASGAFVLSGIPGGLNFVATSAGVIPCRCWAVGTAPPVATPQLLLVEDNSLMRGQHPIGELLFSPPLLMTAIIIAAIAIPIAIHNSKDAS